MSLRNKKILITAGPTHEPIDPVRFIGNHSSGKMGYAIAKSLVDQGATVTLVSGPSVLTPPEGVTFIAVKSAKQMYDSVTPLHGEMDVIILSAAVADYTPAVVADQKIKKDEERFSIELVKTVDIAKELGKLKSSKQLHIGFALETNNEFENAVKKLDSKNLDFIVLNSLRNEGTCFGSDDNKITIIERTKNIEFELKNKQEVASDIVLHLERIIHEKNL